MTYVDGFVLIIPANRLEDYRAMAETASTVWKDHGALSYRECVGDDLDQPFGLPFTKLTNAAEDELVVFSWIEYKSREHRDEVNAKVMADPRIKDSCDPANMPFDVARMAYGGFKTIVSSDS
jgi:uncharacterized protein YbaA (DUF1428 family)